MGKIAKTLIIILILGAAAYFAADYLERVHQTRLEQALEEERLERADEIADLKKRIADLQQEVAQLTPDAVSEEKLKEVFGDQEPVALLKPQETSCDAAEKRVASFFSYLDERSYLAPFELQQSTYELFEQTLADLTANLPAVTGEMKDPMSLMRNIAHFYRVLGKKRLNIVRSIMENESEIAETTMAAFFSWFEICDRCDPALTPCPSMEVLYQYAGFFLNSLAGRSYLLRRDAPIRILTTYYSVLILDKANDQQINPHGIDIRPYISASLYDTTNSRFTHKKQYVARLQALKQKYQM